MSSTDTAPAEDAPAYVDTSKASIARVYDAFLNGKDNYEIDPEVLAHGRALLEENDQTHFVSADIFTPSQVIDNPMVRKHLDFSRPMALFQLGTIHHYT